MGADQQHRETEQGTGPGRPATRSLWSINLVTVAGIPVRLHFSFLLLLGWVAMAVDGPQRWRAVVYVASVFACVVLHELGHSLTALRMGVGVSDIVLYPIGGVARLQRIPTPRQELWISLAGPAVNVAIASMLLVLLVATRVLVPWEGLRIGGGNWAQELIVTNIALFAFNMLPAFPMDGGRVLRAVLAMRLGDLRATQIAAAVGQVFAVLLAVVGILFNPFLLLIAFVVFTGAGQEAALQRSRSLVAGVRVREAVVTDYRSLTVGTTLGEAAAALLNTSQREFPVLHGGDVVGVLDRQTLVQALADQGEMAYVAGVMQREFPVAEADALLEEVASAMQTNQATYAIVMEQGRFLGILTADNVGELLVVRQALQRRNSQA